MKPGIYVVAVSGGVDSVVLLDLLAKNPELKLVVAHFDHGIRSDSTEDRKFVEQLVRKYGLPFEYAKGKLGPKPSEALARKKRYEFLRSVQKKYQAQAIITAHHQDDLLETAIINLLRGTGRRGLSSLKSTDEIKRPLLNFTKQQLIDYAKKNNLTWYEDSTNQDETYLRNWVRHQILPKLSADQRSNLLGSIEKTTGLNKSIEQTINQLMAAKLANRELDRSWFNQLPHDVAKEIMVAWLRQNDLQFDRQRIKQLVIAAKTYRPGKAANISKTIVLKISKKNLALAARER